MKVSPGVMVTMNTAWFAWLPECGWTLAYSQPNNCLARSMARISTSSTTSQPP